MPPLVLQGMHGLGDNLHQRALLRQFMRGNDVWLESSWVSVFHDLIPQGLKVVGKHTSLRTQTKNALRESHLFSRVSPPPGARRLPITYRPDLVRLHKSVLGALCAATGCNYAEADFRLPVPAEWHLKAKAWIDRWQPEKPILLYRPLVERTEWGGCAARNPDHQAYATLFDAIRNAFFVVSIADLVPGKEWMVGLACEADAICHKGELDFETIAALTQRAAMTFCSPGFAVPLSQAVGTPAVCVFGGYERAYSFAGGARYSAYLGIEPNKPCDCFAHNHRCSKEINLPHAREQLVRFTEAALSRAIAA